MDFESILRTIQPFLVLFIALFAAFLTATWVSAVIWTFRDIRSRARDIFAQILATLMVLIFFPLFPIPGLILYLLLRPRETLAEIYERTLEEEALLQGIEERLACPGCNRSIEEDFIVCPTCHTRLKKPCIACGRRLHLRWSICPYCGTSQSQTVPPPPEAIILSKEGQPEAPRLREPMTRPLAEPEVGAQVDVAEPAAFDGDSLDDAGFGAGPYSEDDAEDEDWDIWSDSEPSPEPEPDGEPGEEPEYEEWDTWSDSEPSPEPEPEGEPGERPEDLVPVDEEIGLDPQAPPDAEAVKEAADEWQPDSSLGTEPDSDRGAQPDAEPIEDSESGESLGDGAPEAEEHEESVQPEIL